jgi:hypothetical protein
MLDITREKDKTPFGACDLDINVKVNNIMKKNIAYKFPYVCCACKIYRNRKKNLAS